MVRNYSQYRHNTTTIPETWISVSVGKAITAIVMFVTVLIAIYIPIILCGKLNAKRSRSNFREKLQLWIGRMSCFAAGVFLSTGFMDIFPDVIESIDKATQKLQIKNKFPLASFFTLMGFFLILSIEQMILIYKNQINSSNGAIKTHQNKSKSPTNNNSQDTFLPIASENNDSQIWDNNNNEDGVKSCESTDSMLMNNERLHHQNDEDDDEYDEHASIFNHNKSRIFALMSAMSVHAVFEGLAIGLGSTVAGVTQLVIALSMHKLIIAASLGLNLATAQLQIWIKIVVGLIFALGSPLGIALGVLIMTQEDGENAFYLVAGVLEGIACGTFLYVVFFEILPHELGHDMHSDRGGKLICVILGFIFVSVYILLSPYI